MSKANIEIRVLAIENNIKLWQIANELGIGDANFSRKMRTELPALEKEKILGIINHLAAKRKTNASFIQQMSVKELAEFLSYVESAPLDSYWLVRHSKEVCATRCGNSDCNLSCEESNPAKLFEWWLNQPYKEDFLMPDDKFILVRKPRDY